MIYWTCSHHVSLSSIITPRNLGWWSYFIDLVFMINDSFTTGLRIPWDLNRMKWVFDTLKESILQSSQSTIFNNSPFMIVTNLFGSRPFKKTLVSSANNMGNNTSDTLAISLIYNKMSNGPRMEPWGTPHVAFFHRFNIIIHDIVYSRWQITFYPIMGSSPYTIYTKLAM